MPPARIVEAVDVFEDGQLDVSARVPRPSPNQLSLDRLEERLDSGVVVAVAFAAHRYLEFVLAQEFLIIVRTVLAAAIRVMVAALWRLSQSDGHVQCPDCQITFHAVAYGPTDHSPGMQVQDHSQIKPSFSGPHIADVARPFLVLVVGAEVPVQQVWRDVEGVVAVPLSVDCFAIACRAKVVTLYFFARSTRMPFSRISRPTRRCPTFRPSSFNSSVILDRP